MKKDIMALVKSAGGMYRISNIATLIRWTKVPGSADVDALEIQFDNINRVNFAISSWEITARDYDGIIAEAQAATHKYLSYVAYELCKNLKAGYNNSSCGDTKCKFTPF